MDEPDAPDPRNLTEEGLGTLEAMQNISPDWLNIYKKYGFGEFKKAKFAAQLKEYIESNCTKEDFKNSEIIEIINALK